MFHTNVEWFQKKFIAVEMLVTNIVIYTYWSKLRNSLIIQGVSREISRLLFMKNYRKKCINLLIHEIHVICR